MANVLWFVLAGLWMALAHLILGVVLCLTIIGIPLGLGNFKLAAVAIAPFGKEIVPAERSPGPGGRRRLLSNRRQPGGADLRSRRSRARTTVPSKCAPASADPFGLGARLRRRHEVGEDQGADAVAGRGLRRVLDRRVVVEDVGQPGQADRLDQVGSHDGVHEHVRARAELVEARGTGRCRRRSPPTASPSSIRKPTVGRTGRMVGRRGRRPGTGPSSKTAPRSHSTTSADGRHCRSA